LANLYNYLVMISKSFLKSSFVFTIGGALPMVASIILLPFYANYLGDANYAKLLFYILISSLFQILFSFSVESYFGIKYSQLFEEPEKQKRFIGTVSSLLLIIGAGLILLSLLFGHLLFTAMSREDLLIEFWPFGFFSILTGFFNSYFKAASISLIYAKQSRLFLIGNTINFFATIIISIGGLFLFPGTIIGPIYGRLLSGFIIFLIAQYIFTKNGTYCFDKSFLKELSQFCLPYMFYGVCGWVLSGSDRYILLEFNIQLQDLNSYDLLLKCFFGIEFLQNSLSAVIFPRLYEIWAKNKEQKTTLETNRYFNVFTAINIIQLILFCIFIPIVYKIFIKNEAFYQSEQYIGILSAGYALRSILNFYIATVLFTKNIHVMLKVFLYSTLIQLVLTVIAAKYLGLTGVIYAGLITKILQVFLFMLLTKKVFRYEFNYYKIIVIPFIYIGVNLVQYLVFKEYYLLLYVGQLVLFSILFYAAFRNEIKKVLISFKVLRES
jgi:O-antigen/teichoic acid export membrane protein